MAADLVRLQSVAHAELLGVLGRLDADATAAGGDAAAGAEGGLGGFGDVATWVEARFKLCRATAREWVRVARALRGLPCIAALYASGVVCWDQVRHATRFATADTDEWVASELAGWSGDQLAQLAREHEARTKDADAETDRAMRLRTRRDHRRGGTHFTLFLPEGDAEPLRAALERRAQQVGPDPVTGIWDPLERRMAQAAAMLGAAGLADDGDLDRALAVIHIDADILTGEHPGNATTESGGSISAEVARRLACDGWIQYIAEDDHDRPIGVGRRQRTVPRWLRRLIRHRDGRCRCCGGPIHHIHHIRHWTRLGPTDAENLVGLCWACHHRVHEGGWTITGHPGGALTFTNPYGETVTTLPQPHTRTTRHRTRPTGARPTGSASTTGGRTTSPGTTSPGTTSPGTTSPPGPHGDARPPPEP